MNVEDMVVEDLRRQLTEAQRDVVEARKQGWREGMEWAARSCERAAGSWRAISRHSEAATLEYHAGEIRKQIEEG